MNPNEERKIETAIKKEKAADADFRQTTAGIANGIPNKQDNGGDGDADALNASLVHGEVRGTHDTNINTQTDLELGGVADPGGLDPAMDRQYLKNMRQNVEKNQ